MKVPENQTRIDEAEKFFNLLFGSIAQKKFSYLWTLPDKKTYPFDVSTPDNRHAMAQKAIELNDAGYHVYIGVNVTDTAPATSDRAKSKDISAVVATVTDFDTLGGKHDNPEIYPPDFATAKSFLPFDLSLTVNSGYGLQGYCLYSEPLVITNDNRDDAIARNKKFLDVIRSRAGKFAKAVDAVQDLARVLRVPGTRNYKLGVSDDAPICHLVDVTDCRFDPSDLDQKLAMLSFRLFHKPKLRGDILWGVKKGCCYFDLFHNSKKREDENKLTHVQIDSPEFDDFRTRRMLDVLPVGDLHGNDWLVAMTAIKNLGFSYAEFDAMNQGGSNYNESENRARWDSDTDPNIGIGALCNLAKQYNYDAKQTYLDWLDLHPELRPSRGKKLADDMKQDLDDAIIWLKSLTPESFTVADARDKCRNVALAAVFGFHTDVENFFGTLKAAKALGKNRLKESNADLTKQLTKEERNLLTALVEGVDINYIRRTVDREITAVARARDEYLRQLKVQAKRAEFEQRRAEKAARVIEAKSRLDELRAMAPSPERNAEMIQLIRDACDWHCNRQGVPEYVKATAANIDKIFTLDPNIDGLFGYDQFQQADVFLRPPIWNSEAKKGDEWQDRDDAQLQLYLRRNYGEFTNKDLTLTAVTSYSDARRFHEVKEFFKALPKWDGKPRVKNLFVKFLGAEDSDFTHEVTLNVLTAAVARIFHPGCDYQLAPILLGEQGIGKSYCLSRLFGKWYGSLVDDVGDPHAIDAIQKLWGVEIKEMAAMKKDIDANKRFIDSAKDTRRQAYAHRATTIPRHCVFLITTNNKMCLTDMTGNRRYPIIVCNNKARHYVEGLTDDYIKQIWAEVYAHYNDLFKDGFDDRLLELSKDAQIKSDEIAEEYLRDDGMESEIRAHLETKILPPVIWFLMSREERRKFFVDGGRYQIEKSELVARFKNRAGKKYDTKLAEFEKACEVKEGIVRQFTDKDSHWQLVFYGAVERQHICAVEIYNECFGNDKRKSPTRINEILNRIDNWKLGADIAREDPAYLRQRKVFYREEN